VPSPASIPRAALGPDIQGDIGLREGSKDLADVPPARFVKSPRTAAVLEVSSVPKPSSREAVARWTEASHPRGLPKSSKLNSVNRFNKFEPCLDLARVG
jgi:hypothetical protein